MKQTSTATIATRRPFSFLRSPLSRAAGARGFTLVEIMIVVAIIGIIIAIAVPAFIRARENARGRACQETLAKISGAKALYALETKAKSGDPMPDEDLYNSDGTGYLKFKPRCPSGGEYEIGLLGQDPTCPNYDPDSPFAKHAIHGE